MADDSELLRRYTRDRSEAAFAELVSRYLNLVYFSALCQVGGDSHLAQDVSQVVFARLALKAPQLASRASVAGWLYNCARFVGARLSRGERRRLLRQAEAVALMEANTESDPDTAIASAHLGPVIDDALSGLSERDRELVLLRYFRANSFPEISAQFGLSPDAVRFRVERALDKMRAGLARRGVESTSAALGMALASQAGAAVPAGAVAQLTAAALAGGAPVFSFGPLAQILMTTTKVKIGVAAAAAVIAALLVIDLTREARLRQLRLELRELQSEHRLLAGGAVPASRLAGEVAVAQLATLKSSIAARAATAGLGSGSALKPGMRSMDSLANVGQSTPFATVETALWARYRGDVDALAKITKLMPDAQIIADNLWAGLPPEIQHQFPTSESLVALSLARYFPADWAGYEVTGDRQNGPTPDYWLINYNYQTTAGSTVVGGLAVQQIDGEWTMLVGPKVVEHFAAYLAGSAAAAK